MKSLSSLVVIYVIPNILSKSLAAKPPSEKVNSQTKWGMHIDVEKCVDGCSACVEACKDENGLYGFGRPETDSQWIRKIKLRDLNTNKISVLPMLCQHCESAPCETVCPVNATVHDDEGLNLMVYNRCIGTRYCSNNCPYKVRRFNYYDYNRRPFGVEDGERKPGTFFNDDNELNNSPLHPGNKSSNGEWELVRWYKDPSRGSVPGLDDGKKENGEFDPEWDLVKLSKNPDVSVRMRGVMEKCTYCVQRIQRGKIEQKVEARDTKNVKVPDGKIKTACEQVCPADAIAFGDISDKESEVYRLNRQNRNYSLLGFLDTRPRTTYLAKLRNPNVNMPDYYDIPNSTSEYIVENHGDIFGVNAEKAEELQGKESSH